MADFRKWIYALAVVALLAGFTVPASAQGNQSFQCIANAGTPPIVRAEGFTELVGDLTLNCTGGVPTAIGLPVPQVNFQIFLSTNVTSRVLTTFSSGPQFNEALLIIDEPNTAVTATSPLPVHPILACGDTKAPDTGPSGPGVCAIVSDGNPVDTYNSLIVTSITETPTATCTAGAAGDPCTPATYPPAGTSGVVTGAVQNFACDGGTSTVPATAPPAAVTAGVTFTFAHPSLQYGCGHPNVFQGRQAISFANGGQTNSVVWLGVPFDPPGTALTRTVRITNVRANAVGVGVSSTFTTSQIQMNISVSGNTAVSLNNPQQIVAYVQRGLITSVPITRLDFVQCNPENPDLFLSTTSSPNSKFTVPAYRGDTKSCNSLTAVSSSCSPNPEGYNMNGGFNANNVNFPITAAAATGATTLFDNTPRFRFAEGFASSWKAKNLTEFLQNGTFASSITGGFYSYNGGLENHSTVSGDNVQNVPGSIYNTESGFEDSASNILPAPNPPQGFGNPVTGAVGLPGYLPAHNGENFAGVADHGTRLAMNLTNISNGTVAFVPPIIYLYRQGSSLTGNANGDPTLYVAGFSTGVMVLTNTDANGGGGISPPSLLPTNSTPQPFLALTQVPASGLVVYEILYTDPFSLEQADIPVVVAYNTNLAANLPQTGINTQVAGGFAPFYSTSSASSASTISSAPDVPRFIPSSTPSVIWTISTCSCNLLFPYVASTAGYDTGIAVANTSQDPGATYGFSAKPQAGAVQFWYYGIVGTTGAAAPPPQTSNSVPAGSVLTYVLSNGGGSIGSSPNGLDNRAAGFVGYIIAQAAFQYCHAFAFIGALGAGPTSPGISEGYLGIQLDAPTITRTNQNGENKAH